MASSDVISCTICGAKNETTVSRCTACGAKLDPLSTRELTAEEKHAQRYQQNTFLWKWVAASFVVYLILQGIFLAGLPMVIDAYDPQGLAALMISAGCWFVGGIIVGWLSPGKTFFEPSVGALLAVVPTLMYIDMRSDVHTISLLGQVVGGMLGVMITLLGAFVGEKIQMVIQGD